MFTCCAHSPQYGDASVGLTSHEQSAAVHILPAISTINVYTGEAPFPLDNLRGRLAAVIQANPWLASRLVRTSTGCDMRYHAQPTDKECNAYLVERAVDRLPVDPCTAAGQQDYLTLTKSLKPLLIPAGLLCLGKLDQQQFRVVVLRDDHGRSGLLVTMSHVLADAHTFYRILSQLDSAQQVVALEARRCESTIADKDKVFDARWRKSSSTAVALVLNMAANALVSTLVRPNCTQAFHIIDDEAVQRAKTIAMARVASSLSTSAMPLSSCEPTTAVSHISTHDVVASRFLSVAARPANIVAVNCRNRLPGLTDNMAGSYEALLCYSQQDVQQPEQIRRSVLSHHGDSRQPPSRWAMLSGYSTVTDWASLYHEVAVEGLVLECHLPFYALTAVSGTIANCVLFRLKGQQRALFTSLLHALDAKWRSEAGILVSNTAQP